jgi:preprotein translocase subunit YajC
MHNQPKGITKMIANPIHTLRSFGQVLKKKLTDATGVIDLASIMVGVIVIGVLSSVIVATVFILIPWSQNETAKNNIRTASLAETVLVSTDSPQDYDSHPDAAPEAQALENGSITKPEERLIVDAETDSWIIGGLSKTGEIFMLSSTGAATYQAVNNGDGSFNLPAGFAAQLPDGFTSERAQALLDAIANNTVYGASSAVDSSPIEYGDSFTEDGFTYTIITNRDSQAAVTGYDNSYGYAITIPASTSTDGKTYRITHIGESAFAYNQLTSVTFPNSVTSIGYAAFQGNSLASLTIGDSVTAIGGFAFEGNSLTSVLFGNSVTSIGYGAFANNSLTSVTIPNSVISVDYAAFANNSLTSLTIGDSVTAIGGFAFLGNQLTSVVIPNSVTSIGYGAFQDNSLNSLTMGNSVTAIGGFAFQGNQLTSVTIPDSVIDISDSAFANNSLTSVLFGNSVSTIGDQAFAYNRLTSVTLPPSVTYVADNAFYDNPMTAE